MAVADSAMQVALWDPEVAALRCAVCGRSPAETLWATFKVTYAPDMVTELTRVPCGEGCSECVSAVTDAMSPLAVKWDNIVVECKSDAKKRNAYNEYRLRRAGKHVKFQRNTVQKATRIGTRWEQPTEPIRKQDLEAAHPSIDFRSSLRFEKVKNPQGQLEDVVLVNAGPPKVVLFAEVTAELVEHNLLGQTQLRAAQGLMGPMCMAPGCDGETPSRQSQRTQ